MPACMCMQPHLCVQHLHRVRAAGDGDAFSSQSSEKTSKSEFQTPTFVYSTSTGYVRPGMVKMGLLKK